MSSSLSPLDQVKDASREATREEVWLKIFTFLLQCTGRVLADLLGYDEFLTYEGIRAEEVNHTNKRVPEDDPINGV